MSDISISKYLIWLLRHHPPPDIDPHGYVPIETLLQLINAKQPNEPLFTMSDLERIVATNNKQRFAFNEDQTALRASQGHSISVDLELEAIEPPEILYHGTGQQFVKSILQQGILKRSRQYVHLTSDYQTAHTVGSRHGKPVVFKIHANNMHQLGLKFYQSDNGVWLIDEVPTRFLAVMPHS